MSAIGRPVTCGSDQARVVSESLSGSAWPWQATGPGGLYRGDGHGRWQRLAVLASAVGSEYHRAHGPMRWDDVTTRPEQLRLL